MSLVRVITVVFVCLVCAAIVGAQSPATIPDIPYTHFELGNGLDVVLHEDHSDPIVACAVVVHAGSSREKPGRTGFAHFFEHMSFNDSENVPRGSNRKLIPELGGSRNGFTNSDATTFWEVVPVDAFEKILWIDSDRLGYMINTVTEWALENEKQVVKNEKRQRVDNRPYGHTYGVISKALFPPDHPYSWPVIGDLEDLQAATLADVREFYDLYYGPGNATLAIAGDIDVEEARALVEKWFGEIAPRKAVEPHEPRNVTLEESKSIFHEDNFAKLPELQLTFPAVGRYHTDAYALDMLVSLLSDGKRAPLYQVVVDEQQLAPAVSAWTYPRELTGTVSFRVRANAGVDLDDVRSAIGAALERFEERGFDDRDLERLKALREHQAYADKASILGRALGLATYNTFAGTPDFFAEDVRRSLAVTRDDVMRVYERYIQDRPHVITSFVPRGETRLAVEGAVRAEVSKEEIVPGAEATVEEDPDFTYARTTARIDRSEPALRDQPDVELPPSHTFEAENGLVVSSIEHHEQPLVEFSIVLRGGQLLDVADGAGTAHLLAQLMNEGTRDRTPEDLEDAIGLLGASISVSSDRESLALFGSCLSRRFEEVAALACEMVLEPRFDAYEFERLKASVLTAIEARSSEPTALAEMAFERVVYGDAHIWALPHQGVFETVSPIELEDLRTYYTRAFSPSLAAVHVAGDVDHARARKAFRRLEEWEAAAVELPARTLPEPPQAPIIYFIDVPGSKQSVLRVGSLALSAGDPDYNALSFVNDRLGGGISARLAQVLRIQKGYTYGAYSAIGRGIDRRPFTARTSVRANVTRESLELIRDQLQSYGDTFTEADLAVSKNMSKKRQARAYETLASLRSVLERITTYGLPDDYIARDQRQRANMTLDEAHETIARYLDESRMVYVVVGDGDTQLDALGDLGYGRPILLDTSCNLVD